MARAAATTTASGSDDPFEAVSDFFDSGTWDFIVTMLWVFAIALWLALAFWVFQDARRRIRQPALVAGCTLLGLLLPYVGPLIYMFLRPPEYLADARERELEVMALELSVDAQHCPRCDHVVGPRFVVCPNCTLRLREPCVNCAEPLDAAWRVCPFCETPVAKTFPPLELGLPSAREEIQMSPVDEVAEVEPPRARARRRRSRPERVIEDPHDGEMAGRRPDDDPDRPRDRVASDPPDYLA